MGKAQVLPEIELRTILTEDIEYREDSDNPVIGGYVVRWDKLSEEMFGFREKVSKGAFLKSLSEMRVLSFWNHNSDMVLGNTENGSLVLQEDERGLKFDLTLPDTSIGRDARALIKRGDVKGMSFGFRTLREQWDEADPKKVIRTLLEVRLYEVSPTPMPAYPQSSVAARSIEDVRNNYEEYHTEKVLRETKLRNSKINITFMKGEKK
jgi:HK97 family phage prohead protease